MKKVICSVIAVFMFANSAFAYGSANMDDFSEYKSKYRILYGVILLIGGGFLAYDGFRNVKVDISNPGFKITGSGSWDKSVMFPDGLINLQSNGTVTNTGNVTYKLVAFDVRYAGGGSTPVYYYPNPGSGTDGYPVKFENDQTVYYSLTPGQTISWKSIVPDEPIDQNSGQFPNGDQGTIYTYPDLTDNTTLLDFTHLSWSYEHKYKTEMNNVYEGVAGVLLAGVGVYLLVDYLVGLKKFDYYMKKNDIKFYAASNCEEFKLMLAKRI
jgi:hypothetical protein